MNTNELYAELDRRQAKIDELKKVLGETLVPLQRLGDFIGNTDAGHGASGLPPFDRCAIIRSVRDVLDEDAAAKRDEVEVCRILRGET